MGYPVSQHSLENRSIDDLLDELDEASRREKQEPKEGCRRRHARHGCRKNCMVRYVSRGGGSVVCLPGRMRNLSRNGMGALVHRVFGPREPIEVEISHPDRPLMFMGGLVRFCRYAGHGYYELGIELKMAALEPIFSNNPTSHPGVPGHRLGETRKPPVLR